MRGGEGEKPLGPPRPGQQGRGPAGQHSQVPVGSQVPRGTAVPTFPPWAPRGLSLTPRSSQLVHPNQGGTGLTSGAGPWSFFKGSSLEPWSASIFPFLAPRRPQSWRVAGGAAAGN